MSMENSIVQVLPTAKVSSSRYITEDFPALVVLRSGHGGLGGGAISPMFRGRKWPEWELNHFIAKEVFQYLSDLVPVVWLNPNASNMPNWLREGVSATRAIQRATGYWCLFVSIHNNSYRNGWIKTGGTEILHQPNEPSRQLASHIIEKMQDAELIFRLRGKGGLKENAKMYELRSNACPSIIIECGFINHKTELPMLIDRPDDYGVAIGKGIVQFLYDMITPKCDCP